MRGRLSPNGLIVGSAALAALFLTVTRPSPEGLISVGVGDREVRAAPGKPASSVAQKHPLSSLKIYSRTLVYIKDYYVDPARVDPKQMLYASLDSVQANIPEVLVEAHPERDELTVVVNDKEQTFSTADVDSPWRLLSTLKQVFLFIEKNMNAGADLAEVEYAATNGMLSTLDPHSILMDPEMAQEMDISTSGEFGGLGIVIGLRDDKLTVIKPMPNTPASDAGVHALDRIVKINDDITENLTLDEAVDRMRGKIGSKVVLWVERAGETASRRFELTRASIKVPTVQSQLLSDNVGYFRLLQFGQSTADETLAAIKELRAKGAKGFVMDLRGNPGGLLEEAINVADIFLDKGVIVTTVGGSEREVRRAEHQDTDVTSAPLVVLVSSNSASASEIVAGALKNSDRAAIVGTTSFGKGSVQILYDMSDGSKLKLTIAQYLTPGDISIQSLGITPDIALQRQKVPAQNVGVTDRVQLLPPTSSYREADLKSHLDSSYAKAGAKPDTTLSFLEVTKADAANLGPAGDPEIEPSGADPAADPADDGSDDPADDDDFKMDFEIGLARDLVAKVGGSSRKQLVKGAHKLLAQRRTEEAKKLSDALASIGVDWSPAPAGSGKPTLEAQFAITGHDGSVAAGDAIDLVGTVTNVGQVAAYQVHSRVESDDGVFGDVELPFGKLDPGQARTWTAHLKVPTDAIDRGDLLRFAITDGDGNPTEARPLEVRVVSGQHPVFAYAHQLLDGGDGLVQPGETYKLRVSVKNTGKGISKKTFAVLRNASGAGVTLKKASFSLGELAPGASKSVDFELTTAAKLASKEVVVEMTVFDRVLGDSVVDKLHYPVHAAAAQLAKAGGSIEVAAGDTPIYEGAAADSSPIASAAKGTSLQVSGKLEGWLRVELADGRQGFVAEKLTRSSSRQPEPSRATLRWQVTPPTLDVSVPAYEVVGSSYKLHGEAKDDGHVEDVYAVVWNRAAKVDARKVFYRSNRGAKQERTLDFDATIPLWPGSNVVSVVARENDSVKTVRTIVLYRTDGVATASVAH